MQFAAAHEPLEAAVKLAPDYKSRLRDYKALVPAYRLLPDINKMLEAQEIILCHTPQRAGLSLPALNLASSMHPRGKTDLAVERYQKALAADPKDVAALAVLTTIFTQIKRDRQRGPELTARLESLDRELAAKQAAQLEADAQTAPRTAASIYKDAATAWIEAGDKAKALAAVEKSLASLPEERGGQLVYHWRRGLGDALLAAGEPAQAIVQFEAALAVVTIDGYRKDTEKQLAEAKAAAKQP
jgi:hypothetical protein